MRFDLKMNFFEKSQQAIKKILLFLVNTHDLMFDLGL